MHDKERLLPSMLKGVEGDKEKRQIKRQEDKERKKSTRERKEDKWNKKKRKE